MYNPKQQKKIKTIGDLLSALEEFKDIPERPIYINGWDEGGFFLNVDYLEDNSGEVDCISLDEEERFK